MTLLGTSVDKYDQDEEAHILPEVKRLLDLYSSAAFNRIDLIDTEEELVQRYLKQRKKVIMYREITGGEGATLEYTPLPVPEEDLKEGTEKDELMDILTASTEWNKMVKGQEHLLDLRDNAKQQVEEKYCPSGTKKEFIQLLVGECGVGVISGGFRPAELAEIVGCSKSHAKSVALRNPSEEVRGSERDAVLENEEGLRKKNQCAACTGDSALQIHHIIPMRKDGTKDMENLAALCRSCHREVHSGTWGPIIYDTVDEFWDWVEDHPSQ